METRQALLPTMLEDRVAAANRDDDTMAKVALAAAGPPELVRRNFMLDIGILLLNLIIFRDARVLSILR